MIDLDTSDTVGDKRVPGAVIKDKRKQGTSVKDSQSWLRTTTSGIRLFVKILTTFVPYGLRLLRLRIAGSYHSLTYKPVDSPKNVVVIGGSFAGIHLAKWLADAVPTGHRVVLVERNSHFNFWFAFPRYAVVPGHEQGAFIPYEDILDGGIKKGSLLHIRAEASGVTDSQVLLADGQAIDYSYLVIATGSWQPPPAKMASSGREGACDEIRGVQRLIAEAHRIAVLGSGAVGVEIASDIKSYFPDKSVTLFSSRNVVMPSFGPKLQDCVAAILKTLGVDIKYHTRPLALPGGKKIQFPDRTTEEFDLVLSCTGQRPNSGILSTFLPEAISKQTGRILVTPTLQIQHSSYPNIFALGDVAEHGGPRMARAVHMQAGIVLDNVLDLINGRPASREYSPMLWIEGSIALTVGKDKSLAYMPGDNDKDMLFNGRAYPDDFNIAKGWRLVGAKYPGRQKLESK